MEDKRHTPKEKIYNCDHTIYLNCGSFRSIDFLKRETSFLFAKKCIKNLKNILKNPLQSG